MRIMPPAAKARLDGLRGRVYAELCLSASVACGCAAYYILDSVAGVDVGVGGAVAAMGGVGVSLVLCGMWRGRLLA